MRRWSCKKALSTETCPKEPTDASRKQSPSDRLVPLAGSSYDHAHVGPCLPARSRIHIDRFLAVVLVAVDVEIGVGAEKRDDEPQLLVDIVNLVDIAVVADTAVVETAVVDTAVVVMILLGGRLQKRVEEQTCMWRTEARRTNMRLMQKRRVRVSCWSCTMGLRRKAKRHRNG